MPETDPSSDVANEAEVAEKYLDRILSKLEAAKGDVEKNWLAQITSIAISLALVAGLGTAVAHKVLDDPQSYKILFVVMPIVNTYLFVRFGLLAGVFSKARYNAEKLVTHLTSKNGMRAIFDVDQIYATNSSFEWAHHEFNSATFLFLLTIPLLFSLNHSVTIYLIYKVLGWSCAMYLVVLLYVVIAGICYTAYYFSNRDNTVVFVEKGRNLFIILVVAIAVVATVGLTVALARLDPDPRQIRFDRSRRMGAPEAQSTQT